MKKLALQPTLNPNTLRKLLEKLKQELTSIYIQISPSKKRGFRFRKLFRRLFEDIHLIEKSNTQTLKFYPFEHYPVKLPKTDPYHKHHWQNDKLPREFQ